MRVAFFAPLRFFLPILQPVAAALDGRAEVLITGDRAAVVGYRPHVLVQAAAEHLEYFRARLPDTVIGSVRHGLVGKGLAARLPPRAAARRFDFICVGDDVKPASDRRAGAAAAEYWFTGYPQLDRLFQAAAGESHRTAAGSASVLFAPTWNLGLSAAPLVSEGTLRALLEPPANATRLVIKPHPNICAWRPAWLRPWQRLADRDRRVELVADADADVMPYLADADLLISDASSVVFEFLALDRPIVLITSPDATADPAYDPADIIWRWRDVGEEIHDADQLPGAVACSLAEPDRHGEARRRRAEELFRTGRDGHAAERIAGRILALAPGVPPTVRIVEPARWGLAERRYDLRIRLATDARARRFFLNGYERARLAGRRRSARRRTDQRPVVRG